MRELAKNEFGNISQGIGHRFLYKISLGDTWKAKRSLCWKQNSNKKYKIQKVAASFNPAMATQLSCDLLK